MRRAFLVAALTFVASTAFAEDVLRVTAACPSERDEDKALARVNAVTEPVLAILRREGLINWITGEKRKALIAKIAQDALRDEVWKPDAYGQKLMASLSPKDVRDFAKLAMKDLTRGEPQAAVKSVLATVAWVASDSSESASLSRALKLAMTDGLSRFDYAITPVRAELARGAAAPARIVDGTADPAALKAFADSAHADWAIVASVRVWLDKSAVTADAQGAARVAEAAAGVFDAGTGKFLVSFRLRSDSRARKPEEAIGEIVHEPLVARGENIEQALQAYVGVVADRLSLLLAKKMRHVLTPPDPSELEPEPHLALVVVQGFEADASNLAAALGSVEGIYVTSRTKDGKKTVLRLATTLAGADLKAAVSRGLGDTLGGEHEVVEINERLIVRPPRH